ncbi:MAG: cysteine hydrolase family protein [Candidatus Saccharimonadales bacterium]
MPEKSALLVMDVQNGIVQSLGDKADDYLAKVTKAVEAARADKMPVMFVIVRFRDGFPEMNPRNKMFARIAAENSGASMTADSPATQPAIEPRKGELVIAKKRVSAFAGSDLEMILQAQNIKHLVLTGIATSGVVLSTLRASADKDYQITVLEDCCADSDQAVHQVLTEKVFPRQAEVISSSDWITKLSGAKSA